jgi:mono/diheme cytochrome c family protein
MPTPILRIALVVCSANVVLATMAFSTARAQNAAVDSSSPAAIDAGRKIFRGQGNCATCHGSHLQGTPMAPTPLGPPWKDAKGGGYSAILGVVMNGVSGTNMAGHPGGISDTDAKNVAAYVWSVSQGKAKP